MKRVEFGEVGDEVGRQVEIQGGLSRNCCLLALAFRRYAALLFGSDLAEKTLPTSSKGDGLGMRAGRVA